MILKGRVLARRQVGRRFYLELEITDKGKKQKMKVYNVYLPRSSAGSRLVIMVRHIGFTRDLNTPNPMAT